MEPRQITSQLQAVLTAVEGVFQWLVGGADGHSTYGVTRWLFLRALGVIYLIAFVSLWVQVKGLIGSQGILPAQQYLQTLRAYLGPERYRLAPTVFWLGAGDGLLVLACGVGTLAALLLVCDVAPVGALVVLWVLYLSLAAVGRDFLSFQWDVLLLETGFLAIFFAPSHLVPGRGAAGVPAVGLFLLWWLLFRLTFQSGLVKLTWGDPTWLDLTALDYHFYTQPLPTWIAWYAQQLPAVAKKLAVVLTYVLEIGCPLLIFGPRTLRLVACGAMVFLQLVIFATGNYNFFNLLTIALALLLVDDAAWAALLPGDLVRAVARMGGATGPTGGALRMAVAGFVLVVSSAKFWQNLTPRSTLPDPAQRALAWVEPFRSVNSYGLFRVMTTTRPEIVVEGSDDGATWEAYEFKYKPGAVTRRPRFVEPHQPRLDWQMWFAALGPYELTPWVPSFLGALLEGSPPVLALLARNPFPQHPPRYVRTRLYNYRFTTPAERQASGAWWSRSLVGAYGPVLSLAPPERPGPPEP
jgi:hypothetical protein